MERKVSNAKWSKYPARQLCAKRPSFEVVVNRLHLTPKNYHTSARLKQWVRKNKDDRYVPPALLNTWGFVVNADL